MSKLIYKKNYNPPKLENPVYITYIPHGIDPELFYPIRHNSNKKINVTDLMGGDPKNPVYVNEYEAFKMFRKSILGDKNYELVVLYNNRNIKRKSPGDLVLAFRLLWEELDAKDKDKICLIFHTQPVDDQGTDLYAVTDAIADECNIIFTNKTFTQVGLNMLYNLADVTVNIASNEGFGLSMAESLMAGTMVVSNVTGGLQDQMGFKDADGAYLGIETHFDERWGSNHDRKYQTHGEWVLPVFPAQRHLAGSPITPYIFDDRCDWLDVADRLHEIFKMDRKERKARGAKGREFLLTDGKMSTVELGKSFIKSIDDVLKGFSPRTRFDIINVNDRL